MNKKFDVLGNIRLNRKSRVKGDTVTAAQSDVQDLIDQGLLKECDSETGADSGGNAVQMVAAGISDTAVTHDAALRDTHVATGTAQPADVTSGGTPETAETKANQPATPEIAPGKKEPAAKAVSKKVVAKKSTAGKKSVAGKNK